MKDLRNPKQIRDLQTKGLFTPSGSGSEREKYQSTSKKKIKEQKCIPVGCVPSAAVAVSWGGGGGSAQGVSARPPPPPCCEQNHRQV